jgi:hypothetical protein
MRNIENWGIYSTFSRRSVSRGLKAYLIWHIPPNPICSIQSIFFSNNEIVIFGNRNATEGVPYRQSITTFGRALPTIL